MPAVYTMCLAFETYTLSKLPLRDPYLRVFRFIFRLLTCLNIAEDRKQQASKAFFLGRIQHQIRQVLGRERQQNTIV